MDGNSVRVGIGPIPEPSCCLLMFMGMTALGLRRAKFVLDGGTLRNTGADLKDNTALGKIELTADSRLEPVRSLSVWWDQHYIDMGGHTLTVPIGRDGRYFSIGANTTTLRNGTLDLTSGGWFRVWHGPLDASTVSLRASCATLDVSEQTGVFSLVSAFTGGAREMTFAADAVNIGVKLSSRPIRGDGKVVDWTGRAPANWTDMTFTLDAASRRMGRTLVVKDDGLYVESGFILFVR